MHIPKLTSGSVAAGKTVMNNHGGTLFFGRAIHSINLKSVFAQKPACLDG
jgi:hypothetical protein